MHSSYLRSPPPKRFRELKVLALSLPRSRAESLHRALYTLCFGDITHSYVWWQLRPEHSQARACRGACTRYIFIGFPGRLLRRSPWRIQRHQRYPSRLVRRGPLASLLRSSCDPESEEGHSSLEEVVRRERAASHANLDVLACFVVRRGAVLGPGADETHASSVYSSRRL